MKKLNKKGFTLIELLAVIVIMGILMMVAIPAVSKYMENSRKDTYVQTVKQYVSAVETAYSGDMLECQQPTGNYHYISMQEARALLEKGGSSPYDKKALDGMIFIIDDGNGNVTFNVWSTDSKNNSIKYGLYNDLDRKSVLKEELPFTPVKSGVESFSYSGFDSSMRFTYYGCAAK